MAQRISCCVRDAGQRALVLAADHPYGRQLDALAPMRVLAFDGVQDGDLLRGQQVRLALPFAPGELPAMTAPAERAARLAVRAVSGGAADRAAMLCALRDLGGFDEHGDLPGAPVWLWRVEHGWALEPDRPL